jgi:DNA replication licensing factor MCM7
MGHVPRMMTLVASGENTRKCVPGDMIKVHGVFLPTAASGFR